MAVVVSVHLQIGGRIHLEGGTAAGQGEGLPWLGWEEGAVDDREEEELSLGDLQR